MPRKAKAAVDLKEYATLQAKLASIEARMTAKERADLAYHGVIRRLQSSISSIDLPGAGKVALRSVAKAVHDAREGLSGLLEGKQAKAKAPRAAMDAPVKTRRRRKRGPGKRAGNNAALLKQAKANAGFAGRKGRLNAEDQAKVNREFEKLKN